MNKTIKAATIGLLAITTVACGRIETGQVGVRSTFNKTVLPDEEHVGFYWAIFEDVDEYIVKETEIAFTDMTPKAKDNLTLKDLDVSVFYTVNPSMVAEMTIKYTGQSYKAARGDGWYPAMGVVERIGRGSIYDAVSNFDSLTIHTNRAALEQQIMKSMQDDLDKSDPNVFQIKKVIVRQVLTDPQLEASIQRTVEMEKNIEAKNKEVEFAKAEARRLREEAEGRAAANKIIADSLDERLLRLKAIEAQMAFANQGTHTVLIPQGQPLITNVGK